jgi:NADPH2:quinone reductase
MGLLLIQLLKRLGVHVFTTVSTEAEADLARQAGADQTILYTKQDFEEEIRKATGGAGVHMVLEAVGQTTFKKGFKCLRRRGYMVLYGQAGGAVTDTGTRALQSGSLCLTRPSLGDYTATRDELLQRARRYWGGCSRTN